VVLAFIAVGMPSLFMILLSRNQLVSKLMLNKSTSILFSLACIGGVQALGLPLALSIYDPVRVTKGQDIEEQFAKHDQVYYSKGL